MKVTLYGSLRRQPSMERYARALGAAVVELDPSIQVNPAPPADFSSQPFHWRKYVSYQRAARKWAGDVNHIIDHGYAHLASSLPPGRTVVTVHDMGPLWPGRSAFGSREGGWRATKAFSHSVKTMRKATRVVAITESTRQGLLKYTGWNANRVEVIHSGVEGHFAPVGSPEEFLKQVGLAGKRFILHVGGSTARKNLDVIVRALSMLDSDLLLVKAGAPLEAPERRLSEESGTADRIIEIGHIGDNDLPALYSAAEALVFPSLYEGFGWPPLEAMACGTPAVVSGIPALRETSGPGALILEDPRSPQELAAAIAQCLRGSPRRAELRAKGQKRAANFTWEKTAAAYLEIYGQIAAGSSK